MESFLGFEVVVMLGGSFGLEGVLAPAKRNTDAEPSGAKILPIDN
jgi:hypothetical protein